MKSFKIKIATIFILLCGVVFSNNTFAQQEKGAKKKVVIMKKTVDKDGNETVERIIKEGKEAADFDVEKYLEENKSGAKEIDVNVEIVDENTKRVILNGGTEFNSNFICPMHCKGSGSDKEGECPVCKMKYVLNKNFKEERNVEVTVEGDNVIIMEDGKKQVIKIDGGNGKKEIKTEDGKHIIIMKSDGSDMKDIEIEKMMEGGEKEIKIIKKHKAGNGGFLGVMIDQEAEGVTLLDVVKDSPAEKNGLQKGDIITGINQHQVKSYEDLVEVLSKYKSGETIVALYKRGDAINKAAITLADAKEMKMEEEMIWITDEGEKIEIHEDKDHDVIIEETVEEIIDEDGNKKVIKKKKIIKKEKEE